MRLLLSKKTPAAVIPAEAGIFANPCNDRGFTLIESLVVIGILSLLTSMLLFYNRGTETQISLLKEKASITSALFKAKDLSLANFTMGDSLSNVCGYGVHFEKTRYFIYRDLFRDCAASDRIYSKDDENEILKDDIFTLSSSLNLTNLADLDIFFLPPIPQVYFDGHPATGEKEVVLSNLERNIEGKIIINSAGQISNE